MEEVFGHYVRLRSEMSAWLAQSCRADIPGPHHGGEDEANYALAWFPHFLVTGEAAVRDRFRSLLADLEQWVELECYHGYEPEAEAHHGTEPFLLFLPRYLGLWAADEVARAILEDAAHHIGNWVPAVPDWYDYERDVFHSYQIGSRVVGTEPRFAYELAEHIRFIHIALAAHRVLDSGQYLDWAVRYGRRWAERILAAGTGPLPVLWEQGGRGLWAADLQTRAQQTMAASSHHVAGDPLAGAENLLASGAVYALGDLFRLTGEHAFHAAARRLVEPLIGELLDPCADPAAAALSYYRRAFADTSLDAALRRVLARVPEPAAAPWAMVFPQERVRRERGVGRRNDMIYWGSWHEDGSVAPTREPSTAALALGYQITGDLRLAARALDVAATKLQMARRVLRGGREHADMGGAVCSVAAGHGRNWGIGAVTGCYGPLLLGTLEIQGAVCPLLELRGDALPAGVVSLVQPGVDGGGTVRFYNGGTAAAELAWRVAGAVSWQTLALSPGQYASGHMGRDA